MQVMAARWGQQERPSRVGQVVMLSFYGLGKKVSRVRVLARVDQLLPWKKLN
jgi:hypothetical protein